MKHPEQEQLRLERKLKTLGEMLISLEAYQVLAADGLSKQAAVVVSQDVLRIAKHIGSTDTIALENYSRLDNAMSQAISLEDNLAMGSRIAAAIIKFKEWLMQVFKLVKEQVGALLTSFNKLRAKIEELRGHVKSIPNSDTEVHIPAKLAQRVAIQGDMNEGHFPELRQLASFGAVAYPEAINDFYLELAAIVKAFDPTQDAAGLIEAIEKSLTPLNFTNVDTKTYPGNVMIVHDDTGYNYSIAEVEARIVEEDVVVKIPNGNDLNRRLHEITKVIDIAEKLEAVSSTIETSVNKVIEATDELEKKAKGLDEIQQKNTSAMISTVLATTSKVKAGQAGIIRYLGRVLDAHLAIIEHEVKTATNSQRA